MAYNDKEEIKKIEEAFRIKKPKALDSKRSAFLNQRRLGSGGGGCTNCSHVLHISTFSPSPPRFNSIFATDPVSGSSVPIVSLDDPTAGVNPYVSSSTHPGYEPYNFAEIARFGDKFVTNYYGLTPLSGGLPENLILEFTISQDQNGNCSAIGTPRHIGFGPGSDPTHPLFVASLTMNAMISQNTVIGWGVDAAGNGCIVSIDISGATTSLPTVLFYHGLVGTGGDLVWLPSSNSIVAIDNLTGTVYHWDMNGNSLSSPLTGFNTMHNYAMWAMGGLIYMEGSALNDGIRVIEVTSSGQLQALPNIPDWADQQTLFYYTGDAATSPECYEEVIPTNCYNIGDTGPEGGIIFAVPLGHPQNNGVNQTNFYYEVAKNDIATGGTPSSGYAQTCGTPGVGSWAVAGAEWGVHNKSNITTSTDFGTGHKNTDAIHAYPLSPGNPTGGIHPWLDTHDIAATLCKQHPSTNDDWFLPSLDEFAEMVDASITHGFTLGLNTYSPQDMKHVYWTSSQWRNDPANGLVIANPDLYSWGYMGASQFQPAGPNLGYRCHALSVRPIRRFECEPEQSCGCDCVEYNYRDGQKGRVTGSLAGTDNQGGISYINWWTTNGGTTPGIHVPVQTSINTWINAWDSCIGGPSYLMDISRTDVLGNIYSKSSFNVGEPVSISIWDTEYNFIGKWSYSLEAVGSFANNRSVDTGKKIIRLALENGTHVEGNYPKVSYLRPQSPSGLNEGRSVTGVFFKVEWGNAISYESGCNSTIFGNPHPFNSWNQSLDWPSYCGPTYNTFTGNPTGGYSAIPRYATFQPSDSQGNILPVYPDIYGVIPGYTGILTAYPNSSTQNSCGCDYQVGDTGPAGGIIVATPWMNVNSPADGCVGPIVPALQGMPLKNYTDYYYEISPQNLNTPTDVIVFGSAGIGVAGLNLDVNTNYVTPDTSVTYCPLINPSSSINNEYIGQGEQATGDIMSATGGTPTSAFPGNYQTVENAFKACSDYQSNGYTDWFLPTTQEMEFARNYSPPGTLQDTGSLQTWLNYYWTCNTVVSTTAQLSRIQEPFPTSIGTPDNFAFAVSSDPVSTNSGPHGYGWRTLLNRRYWLNVRAMRKFKCITNSSRPNNKRSKFIEKTRATKDVGPFGVAGYYPLYGTIDGATKASPESSYHIPQFGDVEYYMPNGLEMGVTQFHGDWEPDITGLDNFMPGQTDEVTQPEEQVAQPEQQLPDEPEETPPSIEPKNEGY